MYITMNPQEKIVNLREANSLEYRADS